MAATKPEQAQDRLNREAYIFLNLTSASLAGDIERLCREEDLTEAHFRVLWVLCRETGADGRPMGEIADGLINRAADLTRLMDKMENLGLVRRVRVPDDRRRVVAKATPKGKKVFERLASRIRSLHVEQWSELTASEQRQLVALLDKVLRAREVSRADESWLLRGTRR